MSGIFGSRDEGNKSRRSVGSGAGELNERKGLGALFARPARVRKMLNEEKKTGVFIRLDDVLQQARRRQRGRSWKRLCCGWSIKGHRRAGRRAPRRGTQEAEKTMSGMILSRRAPKRGVPEVEKTTSRMILSQRASECGAPEAEKAMSRTILSQRAPGLRPAPAGGRGWPEAWSVAKASAVPCLGTLERGVG